MTNLKLVFTILCIVVLNACATSQSTKYYSYGGEKYKIFTSVNAEDLNSIKALDLSGKPEEIPKEVYSLNNLVYLNLRNKDLTSISSDICRLTSLKVLFIDGNVGVRLPECLFQMNQIEIVTLMGNKLDSIPRAFGDINQLKYFAIGGNYYTEADLDYFKKKLPDIKIITAVD
jgi:Leucine-rich repeat (LRR) protein